MKIIKHISLSKTLAQILFVLVPTSMVVWFVLWNSNHYFTILKEQYISQTIYFSIGMLLSFLIHQLKLRFLPLFIVLSSFFFLIYKLLDNFSVGEFDSFFISVQYLVFVYLFLAGWIVGWGLLRVSFFPIILSGVLLLLSIFLISKTGEITLNKLLQYFSPILIYSIYQIYTTQALRNELSYNRKFWWRFSARMILFASIMFMLFGGIIYFMFDEIKAKVEEFGGQGKEGENQLLKNNKDGTVENKKSMGMGTSNQRNKNPEPLFCAHINNYFPGTEMPNPLYLTSYHFTKFDTLTETFERDSTNIYSDEFVPEPSKIPLFFTYKDSSRLSNAMSTKNRKTINIEVYKKRLSPNAFIAPSNGYWIQPITVEKDFQKEFTTAYRAKSYVSELNSAYFIYNTDDPQIVAFQQKRFETLRKAPSFETLDKGFLDYYTFFPSSNQYQKIKILADSLAQGKIKGIDKILSVRDYFTSKNELGEQTFKYTDNPGIPGLPGSSKLMEFLFETKKGYCAYYAGATVFILRAMGIPSRIVTGFLTVDRSDKNTGWYWFYEDQSHGWVQVYFPEYGWIDFDTTVGNDEAGQSPAPDGTPPMQPPNPAIALAGKMIDIDTLKKVANMNVTHIIFKDNEYANLSEPTIIDIQSANVWKDSLKINLSQLHRGDDVMAVSYDDRLLEKSITNSKNSLLKNFPSPLPIDEIYVKNLAKSSIDVKKNEMQNPRPFSYYMKIMLSCILGFIFLIFMLPSIVYLYYKLKAKNAKTQNLKSYYIYKSATFLLNQLNVKRGDETAWKYAHKIVDVRFQTNFSQFMNLYLKQKYANQTLNEIEQSTLNQFFKPFEQVVKSNYKWTQRFISFLNLNGFINYFYISEPENIN